MDQKVAVIEQNPLTLFISFDAGREIAVFFQPQADLVGDGLILARTRAGADDEVIGETGDSGEIQNSKIGGLLGPGRVYRDLPAGFGGF